MKEINQKNLGSVLIGIGIILIFVLTFMKIENDKQGAFMCEIIDNDPNLDMSQCPAHQSSTSWLIFSSFGMAFLVLGSGIYMVFMSKDKDEKGFKKIDISKLDDEEKDIYNIIKKKEGSIYQSDLIKETKFSKVKITRILDRMENKNIIDRKRRGMTNIVVLK